MEILRRLLSGDWSSTHSNLDEVATMPMDVGFAGGPGRCWQPGWQVDSKPLSTGCLFFKKFSIHCPEWSPWQ